MGDPHGRFTMPHPFDIQKVQTATIGLRACLVLVAAAHDGLSLALHKNLQDILSATTPDLGALLLCDYFDAGQRVKRAMLFRNQQATFTTDLDPTTDFGSGTDLRNLLEAALLSVPPGAFLALGISGHGTGLFGSISSEAAIVKIERRLRKKIPSWRLPPTRFPLRQPRGRPLPAHPPLPGPPASVVLPAQGHALPARVWRFGSMASPLMLHVDGGGRSGIRSVATIFELGAALENALKASNRKRVDLLFADACVDATFEFWCDLGPLTEVFVASELSESTAGWPYAQWLSSAPMGGTAVDWARSAVQAYQQAKKAAREPFSLVALGLPDGALTSFGDLATALRKDAHASAVLQRSTASVTLQPAERAYDFDTLLGVVEKDPQASQTLRAAATGVRAAFKKACLGFETHTGSLATGLSMFVPSFAGDFTGSVRTAFGKLTLAKKTEWDEFLDTYP
jgi:hypothetical protein